MCNHKYFIFTERLVKYFVVAFYWCVPFLYIYFLFNDVILAHILSSFSASFSRIIDIISFIALRDNF